MISHSHRCIFIHIPKTAGMSIEQAFLRSLNLDFINGQADKLLLSYNKDPEKGPPSLAHLSPKEYINIGYVSSKTYNDYFTFSFVRDPWHRAISLYKHFEFHRVMSFLSFLKYEMPQLKKDRYYFVKPQVEYLFNDKGEQMVDFIGRFEQLNEDFEIIKSQLEHSISDLQYINRSKTEGHIYSRWNLRFIFNHLLKRPTRLFWLNPLTRNRLKTGKIYTAKCKELVIKYYQKDIEHFKYFFPKELSR